MGSEEVEVRGNLYSAEFETEQYETSESCKICGKLLSAERVSEITSATNEFTMVAIDIHSPLAKQIVKAVDQQIKPTTTICNHCGGRQEADDDIAIDDYYSSLEETFKRMNETEDDPRQPRVPGCRSKLEF